MNTPKPSKPYIFKQEPDKPLFLYVSSRAEAEMAVSQNYGANLCHLIAPYYNADDVVDRYPNLLCAIAANGLLTNYEAVACLRDHHNGNSFSGEAVNVYGGTHAILKQAITHRHPPKRSAPFSPRWVLAGFMASAALWGQLIHYFIRKS